MRNSLTRRARFFQQVSVLVKSGSFFDLVDDGLIGQGEVSLHDLVYDEKTEELSGQLDEITSSLHAAAEKPGVPEEVRKEIGLKADALTELVDAMLAHTNRLMFNGAVSLFGSSTGLVLRLK